MKILLLCLLTTRTCLGQGEPVVVEQYHDTITEFLKEYPDIIIENKDDLAVAAKYLAANEAEINAHNEKYANGEANYRQILFIPEHFFLISYSISIHFFFQVILYKKKSVFLSFFERIRAFSQLDNTNNL